MLVVWTYVQINSIRKILIDFLLTGAAVDATNIHETADKTATETPMDVGETNQDPVVANTEAQQDKVVANTEAQQDKVGTEKGKLLVSSSICAHTSSIAYW